MSRELPRDQTKKGFFSNRAYNGDWYNDKITKRVKSGQVCPRHHMVLNAHGNCPMCGFEYKTGGIQDGD